MAPPPPTTPPPSQQDAQYAQQFLTTALSQRGPSSLPYAEDAKWLIRQHLVALAESFPSLRPKTSPFTHNDGRTLNLLHAEGTIPIVYHGSVYNIPAVLWLLEPYPRHPPAVFLSPTPNMIVKPHHPLVDHHSASVSIPYLRSWIFPSSNLVDLVRSLSHLFSQDPPLYSRPNPNPNPNHIPIPNPSPSPSPNPNPNPNHRPYSDPAEVYRRNAISKIVDSVHDATATIRKSQENEMEALFTTQSALRQRGDELSRGLRAMSDEREGLEQQLQLLTMNVDVLGSWVRDNEGKAGMKVDPDAVFEPSDSLSRQMLESAAADLAIEDTIYSLDRAVQEGAVPFDVYLKNVRALSREQFFHRAMSAKVRAAQVQSQVASMAARVPRYSS